MKIWKVVLWILIIIALVYVGYNLLTAQTCVDRAVPILGDDGCYYIWEQLFGHPPLSALE